MFKAHLESMWPIKILRLFSGKILSFSSLFFFKERERGVKPARSAPGCEVLPIWTDLALGLSCTKLRAAVVLLVLSEFSGLSWIIQRSQQHLSLCTDLVYIRSLQVGLETRSPVTLAINSGQAKKQKTNTKKKQKKNKTVTMLLWQPWTFNYCWAVGFNRTCHTAAHSVDISLHCILLNWRSQTGSRT